MELGRGEFSPHSSIQVNNPIFGLSFVPNDPLYLSWNLLTLASEEEELQLEQQQDDQSITKSAKSTLQLWKITENSPPSNSQTVVCHLPFHPKYDPTLATTQLSYERSAGHYVLVSDRYANISLYLDL